MTYEQERNHKYRVERMKKRESAWPGATWSQCMSQALDERAEAEYSAMVKRFSSEKKEGGAK